MSENTVSAVVSEMSGLIAGQEPAKSTPQKLLSADLYQAIFRQMQIPAVLTDQRFSLFLDVNMAASRLLNCSISEFLHLNPRHVFPCLAIENLPQSPFITCLATATGLLKAEITTITCDSCLAFLMTPLEGLQAETLHLRAMNQRKNELIANLSHEVRTPLTAILGWPELLLDQPGLPEQVYQAARSIKREAHLVFSLIEDLFNLSRVEADHMHLNIHLGNLSALLLDVLEMVQKKSQEKSQQLELFLPENELWVPMDALKITQVMINLLTNAIKFTPPGGRIRVRAAQLEQAVHVWIEDNGMGITAAHREHIFQRCVRAPEAEHIEGTGIGLSLVKTFIELHGGRVGVESKQGEGSTFWFYLPLETNS